MQTEVHGYFRPSFPCFSGLVLRTTFHGNGVHLGSLRLQACTWSGNFCCLKDIPIKCQGVVRCRGGSGVCQCDKSKVAKCRERDFGQTLIRASRHTSLNTDLLLLSVSLGPREGSKSMEESRTAAAYSRVDLALPRS